MADNGEQTEVVSGWWNMCNLSAEKTRRTRCEFDLISYDAKCHVDHEYG